MVRRERGEGYSEPSGTGLAREVALAQQDRTPQSRGLCSAPVHDRFRSQRCRGRLSYLHQSSDHLPDLGHKFIHNATNTSSPSSSLR